MVCLSDFAWASGPPPPVPEYTGIYRLTSAAERVAMGCKKRCFEALSMFNCSDASMMFQGFARKVTSELRAVLHSEDAQEPSPVWVLVEWPLAQRVWNLWAANDCPSANAGMPKLEVLRRLCDPREEQVPCALELRIQQPGCSKAPTLVVRERVSVGSQRISALQVGAAWDTERTIMHMPSVIPTNVDRISALFFPVVRRRHDMTHPGLPKFMRHLRDNWQ